MGTGFHRIKYARDVAFAGWVVLAVTTPLVAQVPNAGVGPSKEREALIIGGKQAPGPTLERCVEVEIGHESAFGCLNQKLKREVDRVNPSLNLPPLDARSPDVRIGNVNEAAVRQQYGSNYGRSAIPFRPPTPVYVLPRR
jgi:hypothetical protein